jgi:hypothetical protein
MVLWARLAGEPYFEEGRTRCDCFLLELDSTHPMEPPALIQLFSGPRIKHGRLPAWKDGDILKLEPTASCGWNDVQETGRCYVDLAILVTCEGREGLLTGMVPANPNPRDFTQDAE